MDRNLLTNKSTGLSVQLSQGKIDPKDVVADLNKQLKDKPDDKFLLEVKRQLIFREFANKALREQTYKQPVGARSKDSKRWEDVRNANTGIPIVDASIRDLKDGLPHNRARLLLARHLIRTENFDPGDVAMFYKEHLKDYSPVLNTFNIVQAASGANFAEPYYRKSNALTAAKKLDPTGEYQRSKGVDPDKFDKNKVMADIIAGNEEWSKRWKKKEFVNKPLWPTKDKDKGKYFLDKHDISAKGHFGSFYKNYLKNEQ